jgi:hypothetical protein
MMATPIAERIENWFAFGPHENDFATYLSSSLRSVGWQCPEAFFEDPQQITCPATGNLLRDVDYNDSFGFAMDEAYVVLHNGGCAPQDDSCWFSEDYRQNSFTSGWYLVEDCAYVDDTLYPDWYIARNAIECSSCDSYVWQHNADSHGRCHICSASAVASKYLGGLEPVSFGLLPYDDRSSLRLPGQSRKTDRYGIELEILVEGIGEVGNRRTRQSIVGTHAYHALQCFPASYAVAKRDGSLYDCGFELVTKPDTYDKMHETLATALDKFSPLLTNTGTCEGEEIEAGLHINMERKGKSLFHQAKILYFMFTLGNRGFLTTVAGRCSDHYAGFPSKARWRYINDPATNNGSEKYVAVYVKDKVLEFRLFCSSTSRIFVLSCLEFCEALTHFTKYASAQSLTYEEFISFVLATNKFPNLIFRLRTETNFKPFLQNKTTK